jgi:putative NADH-flavin reductase
MGVMNIAVLAANGRTGSEFVRVALAHGHTVRAGVHGKHRFKPHERLTIVDCDATNPDEVINLLTTCEAVASFIGHVRGSAPDVQSKAIDTLIAAMQQLEITRVVSLTGTGVRQPGDNITLLDRVLNLSISIIDPARVKDGIHHAEILKDSKLEWTIIRVLKLQKVPKRPYQLLKNGPTKPYVGRREVAEAALEVLENHTFVREMPIIANK